MPEGRDHLTRDMVDRAVVAAPGFIATPWGYLDDGVEAMASEMVETWFGVKLAKDESNLAEWTDALDQARRLVWTIVETWVVDEISRTRR